MIKNYVNKIIISKINKIIKINRPFINNKNLEFPFLKINILNSPIPDGRIKAQYNVGLSTVTIIDDQYIINDPFISEEEKEKLEKISSQLLFSIPIYALKDENILREYLEKLGVDNEVLYYFLRREILGYGVYDVLIQDDNIEDITAWPNGTTCNHKLFGSLKVNISMSESEFNKYIEKLVYLSGKSISLHNPMLSIRLSTNDRLTVTYAREVSDKPSFSIRKFPKQPWSITSIMMMRTISPEMAAWLMLLVKYKKAILVCGPVGSGKTSLINALCSLIPADQIIVTCEDTPELKLARQNWISLITRESSTIEEGGEIGMFDLVKHSLRYPASYIIVGEIRGEEGRVWAQAIATGHGGITSLHAETPEGAIERLKSDPINVAEGTLKELSTIVIMKSLYIKNMGEKIKVKRVMGIYDINPLIKPICLFKYNSENDSFIKLRDPFASNTASKIMEFIPREKLIEEYQLYTKFLYLLSILGYKKPELTLHTKVTELVWKLYEYEDIPEELLIPEVQLVE
jgi:flagellar protein FlaI